jgi:uncharacterized Ntn-hydrolase superfamily protein
MTFSIVTCDLRAGAWGVAVASRYLAVGGIVPAVDAAGGALATQARTNVAFRGAGLAALRAGAAADAVVRSLIDGDEGRDERQLAVVDGAGRAAAWTGAGCQPYAGQRTGRCYAVAGNLLTGPEVLDAMVRAWSAADPAQPLAQRLVAALAAGDAAGGDRRGRQSAAVLVARRDAGHLIGTDTDVDLRVDDAPRPVEDLRRLVALRYPKE